MGNFPLNGLRILDFSWIIAGPTAARHLALMGAEVIKIGSSRRPDPSSRGAAFQVYNQSKEYCSLNLSTPQGLEIAKELVTTCDVVIENFAAGVFERIGLDYETLIALRPDVILVSSAGTGHTGPDKDYVAYGSLLQHYTGWNTISGYGKDEPIRGGLWADPWVGMELAMITVAAINHRMKTGKGQYIDFSMAESLTASIPAGLLEYQITNQLPTPIGNDDVIKSPHGLYKCKGYDAWIAISIQNEVQWGSLCKLLDIPKILNSSNCSSPKARQENKVEIDQEINKFTSSLGNYEAMDIFQNHGIPSGPSLNISEAYSDPHNTHSGYLAPQIYPDGATRLMPGMPWKTEESEPVHVIPAPQIGDSNHRIYMELMGMSSDAYQECIRNQIIY
ncbi:MAG TPA: CoA transferase [SAR202 cluster bacterium]|jgi:benzylsuccinate CoA-transferase BbsF subunit|nr:CoA transferase [SAR202 cluster bacterium]|tara:strand:- start:7408 stop:8580 length:1173 start_codon:yes stop_codon:yes gene_type:complete